MPTPNRRSTGKAAPKTGAASAVPAQETTTVDSETPITVDATNPPAAPTRDALRALAAQDQDTERTQEQAAQAAADQLGVPVAEGIPAAARRATVAHVEHEVTPKITEGVEGQVGAVEEPVVRAVNVAQYAAPTGEPRDPATAKAEDEPTRDLAALRRLADTSGDPVTPYPADGVQAPNPLDLLPEVRATYNWSRENDPSGTARVLADGWRALVSGTYQFARRGDRVTAPLDVLRSAAKHGIVVIEE